MARRRPHEEGDTRPAGSLVFADPSTAKMTGMIHTYNEPHSPRSKGSQNGIRSMTPAMVPWGDHTGSTVRDSAWSSMNRKRGVSDDEDR